MVSVLIPTYNRPQLLLRALRSLQLQLYPDWEAVVVDDGDGSGILAAHSLRDPRILGVRNEGRGQVHARNTGLAHATGSIIALLDDDAGGSTPPTCTGWCGPSKRRPGWSTGAATWFWSATV